jgi:KTSC domain
MNLFKAPIACFCATLSGALFYWIAVAATTKTVPVKYFGNVDLGPYACTDVTRASFIRSVCFNKAESRALIDLNGTIYAYCSIPEGVISAFMEADSMGRVYDTKIKGRYDCR